MLLTLGLPPPRLIAESPADSCNRTKISSGVSPNQSSTASTSPHPRALQSPFCMNVIKLTHMGTHVALHLPVFLGARGRKWVLKCFFQLFLFRKRLLLTTPSSRLCPCCYEGQRVNGCFRASFYLQKHGDSIWCLGRSNFKQNADRAGKDQST